MSYRCVCFSMKKFDKYVDRKTLRFSGTDVGDIRCTNGTSTGICNECKNTTWKRITARKTKSFHPEEILNKLLKRMNIYNELCQDVPKYLPGEDVPNIVEHNKVVLSSLHTLLYQNYVLHLMEERKRVTEGLRDFKEQMTQDTQSMKTIQEVFDTQFSRLSSCDDNLK